MLKMIGRFKPITILFATLLVVIGLLSLTCTEANQLLYDMAALKDAGSLAVKLQDTRAAVSNAIVSQLSDGTQRLLGEYDGASEPSTELRKALLSDLNRRIQAESLYDAQIFADIELSEGAQALIAQNPQNGETLVRLNRMLLSDAYPSELALLSEQQMLKPLKGIEACRKNLRHIKLALQKYRVANADADPQWLSDLSPEYLEKKMLICPADATAGTPGVLTERASDPTLPCSYLYELRPSERMAQEVLSFQEGDMTPIVRCEHHLLNLSVGGKLYRNGPQRDIYTSNKTGFSMLDDFMQDLRAQHGEAFLKTQSGREKLKQATERLIIKQLVPAILNTFEKEIYTQLETQLGKSILNTPIAVDMLKQATLQIRDQVKEQLQSQLQARLGEEFLNTKEGQDILKQLSVKVDAFSLNGR